MWVQGYLPSWSGRRGYQGWRNAERSDAATQVDGDARYQSLLEMSGSGLMAISTDRPAPRHYARSKRYYPPK